MASGWVSPVSFSDPAANWSVEERAFDDDIDRNVIRQIIITDCRYSDMAYFTGKMFQGVGKVTRERAYSASSRRICTHNTNIIRHDEIPVPFLLLNLLRRLILAKKCIM